MSFSTLYQSVRRLLIGGVLAIIGQLMLITADTGTSTVIPGPGSHSADAAGRTRIARVVLQAS